MAMLTKVAKSSEIPVNSGKAFSDCVLSRTTLRDLVSTEKTMGELIKTYVHQAMEAFQDASAEPKKTKPTRLNPSTVCGPRR